MTGLLGAYVLWRIARRLVPLLLIAGLALVLLAPNRHLGSRQGHLRGDVQVGIRQAQQGLTRALEGLGR